VKRAQCLGFKHDKVRLLSRGPRLAAPDAPRFLGRQPGGSLDDVLGGMADRGHLQHRLLDAHRVPAYAWDGPVVDQHRVVPWSAVKLRKAFKGADDAEIERQLRIGREFVDRLAGRTFGDDLPSAYELSQLGRWQGAGKDDVWIGKLVMLGSAWLGILRL
jgi:hypothetical protein